jgi:peptidoglycan hydrolase-like protein with peptidoglycan-binding domain
MTIAKDFAAKASVALVAAAMIFASFAPSVKAQSAEDLQKMINDLLAQIASLQSQVGQGGSMAAGVCPYTWTRDLNVGATGMDVMKLQQFLNSDPDTRVAATGVGSAGMETEYYGPATAAAVSKMQVKYRAEVLTPSGLVNPTGYFGPSSRAKANAACAAAPVTPVTPGDDEDEDESEDEDDMTLGGEASLDDFQMGAADEDEYEEGSEDAPVAEATYEFQDGDAEISRIDVQLVGSGDEQDPWDTFESVSLWVDGDMVAEVDASDEDNYLGDEDDGILRFSGLDIVAMEDEEVDVIVAVTINNSIDLGGDADAWTVAILNTRFFDADGVATTLDNDDDSDFESTESFTVEEAGFEDEVIVKTSSSDPDSATLQVEDDSKSDWFTVFIFDLDTDDSMNDIELNEVVIDLALSQPYNTVVDDAELVIDGVTVDDFDVSSTTVNNPELSFDVDGDVTIDAGDRVAAELKLRFKALVVEGTTVEASIDGADIDAEGADDVTGEGAATGEEHTLRSTGIVVELDSTDADVQVVDGNNNDYATFVMTLDVTAFEQDVFIPVNAASTSLSLVDGNGATIANAISASSTVVITSSAEEGGAGDAFFEINEGQTETVTITVTYTPGTDGSQAARLVLGSLVFDETGTVSGANDETWNALPATTYRTAVVTITD